MKNKSRSYELISYRQKHQGTGDFNGPESSFTLKEQVNYLKTFAHDYAFFTNANLEKEVVSDTQIAQWKEKIALSKNDVRKREYLKDLTASSQIEGPYEYLHAFSSNCQIVGGNVLLKGEGHYPSAGLLFAPQQEFSKIHLSFSVSQDFKTPLRGKKIVQTMGKVLEFRHDGEEIVRLQFYSDGSLEARTLEKDVYHYTDHHLGSFSFENDGDLQVIFDFNEIKIIYDNHPYSFPNKGLPNELMATVGFYPMGDMSLRFLEVTTNDGTSINPFVASKNKKEKNLGQVNLPFGIAGREHANETLKLRKAFTYSPNEKELYLHLSCLDPCGRIRINDQEFLCDDFLSTEFNLTPFLQNGENLLELIVSPRCPENFCSWHRGKDPYYAWFIGEAYLEERAKETHIDFVKIVTISAKETLADCFVDVISDKEKEIALEVLCDAVHKATFQAHLKKGINHLKERIEFGVSSWSPENPSLHEISFNLLEEEKNVDTFVTSYGFRTISQKDGGLYLNDEPYVLKGALLMQYPWPIERLPLEHLCPSDETIIKEALQAKAIGCNCVRMHVLGYGNAEERYARIFDAIGLCVIWTTRYIDSVITCLWDPSWKQKEGYLHQIKDVINHPSIIIYEGANEQGLYQKDIDNIYEAFVGALKSIDTSRLLCPVSHLYYAADSYDLGCFYYLDDGKKDAFGKNVVSSKAWNDPLVLRSSHAYNWLLGYGAGWDKLRKQDWSGYRDLLNSHQDAYLVSEYAIIGRANPNTDKAKQFFNDASYECGDETSLGYHFENDFLLSQAYQALSAKMASKKMLGDGVDGLLWCSLNSGANEGSYLKPPLDYAGYPKLAFYALKESFQNAVCFDSSTDLLWGENHLLSPLLCGSPDYKKHDIFISIEDLQGKRVISYAFEDVLFDEIVVKLDKKKLPEMEDGYYRVVYEVSEK